MNSRNNAANAKPLNWSTDINTERSLTFINWKAVEEFAIIVKRKLNHCDSEITCQLSDQYSMGGLHVVRRLDFHDGTSWVARLQQHKATPLSLQRLTQEVYTLQAVQEQGRVPVPEIFAYEDRPNNPVGVAFMIMEYIPADTAMDSFGGYNAHRGRTPTRFKRKFYDGMAKIQVEMTSVRFPKIGSIIKVSDGTYHIGPIPGFGGPFDSAADFFTTWGKLVKFPYNEKTIRERTPPELADEILTSIKDFPSQIVDFAQHHCFQSGPFPIIHTDLYKSNILIDSEYNIQSVIDWEDAIVAPWELVEFIKDLSIMPAMMDGPLYHEDHLDREKKAERRKYVAIVQKMEEKLQLDNKFSTVLGNRMTQNLCSAIWLYRDGRIGFYTNVLKSFE